MEGRGFEIVTAYAGKHIHLPVRKTTTSAGYDIEAAENTVLAPQSVTIVPTGLKAYMEADEYLAIHIRSGISIKHGLMLVNSVGVIDSDYYNNPDNEGHIMIAYYNTQSEPFSIAKGERIGQGIFVKYLITRDDQAQGSRIGGFGSTGLR